MNGLMDYSRYHQPDPRQIVTPYADLWPQPRNQKNESV